jgi:hypothetical protein
MFKRNQPDSLSADFVTLQRIDLRIQDLFEILLEDRSDKRAPTVCKHRKGALGVKWETQLSIGEGFVNAGDAA